MIGRIQDGTGPGSLAIHGENAWRESCQLHCGGGAGLAGQGRGQRRLGLSGQLPRNLKIHLSTASIKERRIGHPKSQRQSAEAAGQGETERAKRPTQEKVSVYRSYAAGSHRRPWCGTRGIDNAAGIDGRRGLSPGARNTGHQAHATRARNGLKCGHGIRPQAYHEDALDALTALVHYLDGEYRRIIDHWNKIEVQLSLRGRPQSTELLYQRVVRSRFLQNIEPPLDRRSVAEYIKHALTGAAASLVLLAPVGLGEVHGRGIHAWRHRDRIRKVAVSLIAEQIGVGRARDRF